MPNIEDKKTYRIGWLYPSGGINEAETARMLPAGVSVHISRIPMKDATYETLSRLSDFVEDAASLLADIKGLGAIAFACTAGSFIKDRSYDREITERIFRATGVPSTTMADAMKAGLRAMDIKKLVLLTPYKERITLLERDYLHDEGFNVLDYRCLGLDDIAEQNAIEPEQWYRMVLDMQNPEADGYLLSCGGMRVVDVIERLETELGKPVITSNQATLWRCLRITGYQKPVKGFGRLMMTP